MIFVRHLPDSSGFWTVIDGQYLMDFMRAIGESNRYQMSLRFNGGSPIASGPDDQPELLYLSSANYQAESSRYPISVSVTVPAAELIKA
ncbi:hypothetical protein E05_45840 [Plautia stali symbiont]|nr:hypothetical protein E05_45840 [Plautia stali symbiont]